MIPRSIPFPLDENILLTNFSRPFPKIDSGDAFCLPFRFPFAPFMDPFGFLLVPLASLLLTPKVNSLTWWIRLAPYSKHSKNSHVGYEDRFINGLSDLCPMIHCQADKPVLVSSKARVRQAFSRTLQACSRIRQTLFSY